MASAQPLSLNRQQLAQLWLLLLIMLMPLWMGGTGDAARFVLAFSGICLPLLLLAAGEKLRMPPGMIPLSLFCGWLLIQLLPLPPFVLQLLSPGYSAYLEQGLWVLDPGAWRPLSLNPAASLNEFFRFAAYSGFYLAATNLCSDSRFLRRLLKYLVWFVGAYAFLGLVQFFLPSEQVFWFFADWPARTSHHFASFVNGNHYASLIGMVFPLLVVSTLLTFPASGYGSLRDRFTELFTDPQLSQGLLYGLFTILAMVSVFFSLSRGGTLSLFGASFVLLILLLAEGNLHGKMLFFVLVLIGAVGLCGFFGWEPLLARFSNTFYETGGLKDQRLVYWADSLQLLLAAPWTGSGAGTFIDAYPAWQTAKAPGLTVDHAHNDYIELVTDLGLLGVGLVVWFWASLLGSVVPALKRRRNKRTKLTSLGVLAGLVAILLHSITDFNLAIPANGLYLFLLFSVLVAASHSSSRRNNCELPELSLNWRKVLRISLGLSLFLLGAISMGEYVAAQKFSEVASLDLARASADELSRIERLGADAEAFAPLNAVYPMARGTAAALRGDLKSSLLAQVRSLALKPLDNESLRQAARILFAQGELVKAETVLRGALASAGMNWEAWRELAGFLIAQGRLDEGFQVLRAGLAQRPEQTSKAIEELVLRGVERKLMVRMLPELSFPWSVYGDVMTAMGDLDAAEQAYRRGVEYASSEERPDSRIFWRYLELLERAKRYAEALELTRHGLVLFPQNQHLLARQGILYEREGLRDRAIEAYRAAILIDPRPDWVRKRLEKLERGKG